MENIHTADTLKSEVWRRRKVDSGFLDCQRLFLYDVTNVSERFAVS
jgi:hypothetical protein